MRSRAGMCWALRRRGRARPPASCCPMLTILEKGRARARMPRTLILEPTRELAAQVEEQFNKYGRNHKLNVALLIGGVSYDDQAQDPRPRRRRADRHAGAPARSYRPRQDPAQRRRDPRHRRGRPHARHGLHPGHRADLQDPALHPPDAVLLGHHAAGDPAPRRPVPVQSDQGRGVAAGDGRRHGHAAARSRRPRGGRQAGGAPQAHPRGDGLQERDHLLQPQARRRHPAALARAARLQCRRAPRRHGPALAHLDARRFPQGPPDAPRRQRRRRARPRHPGGQPHLQFRRAAPTPRTMSTASAAPAAPD